MRFDPFTEKKQNLVRTDDTNRTSRNAKRRPSREIASDCSGRPFQEVNADVKQVHYPSDLKAPAANADEVDKAVNAGTMVGETSVVDTALQLICPGPQGTAASKYNASAQCLHRLHYRLGLQRHTIGSGKVQRHAMYLQAFSLRLAYEGLLASFGQEALTDESRMLWPEAQKTFFMRFCLLSCNSDQKPNPLSPRAGCLLPLHAMPEFTPRRCTQCTPNSYQARSPVCVAIMRTSNMASGAAPLPVLLSPKRI
ncbi:uncharacterized protein [Dermacentor albipictus]|uniref:uncharacterized protein isoform X3 n=1 Tax=Dermacentor albipictus TaxID=60249 RepID=UPI0038FC480A